MSSFHCKFSELNRSERERERVSEIERGRKEGRQGVGGGFCSFVLLAIVTCWIKKKEIWEEIGKRENFR